MLMSDTRAEIDSAFMDHLGSSIHDAVRHAHLIGSGAVAELEQKLCTFYGTKHALAVSSGTAGLLAVALAIDLNNSDFIAQPLVFGGSLASWLMLGNHPVFTDIDPQTLTLDPNRVRENISDSTRAILGIDTFGNPSDSEALRRIADEAGIWYISDSCQGLGAFRNGRPAGYLADAIVVSFTSTKTIAAGEGGAIITNNTDLYHRLLWFTQHPLRQKRELGLRLFNEFAVNTRIHPLAASWANATFETSISGLRSFQRFCLDAISCLNESGLIEPVDFSSENILPSFYCLSVARKQGVTVKSLLRYLGSRGIKATAAPIPATLVHKNTVFLTQFGDQFSLPRACFVAEQAEKRTALSFAKQTVKEAS